MFFVKHFLDTMRNDPRIFIKKYNNIKMLRQKSFKYSIEKISETIR